jgi:hypothetical protein
MRFQNQLSVRTDSGNDISNEKPSLVEGEAGGGGGFSARPEGNRGPAAFVAGPIGVSAIAGGSQARRTSIWLF